MIIATIRGVKKVHKIHCDRPALRKEDLEPEIPTFFVGLAYAVFFSVVLFYLGIAVWHMMQ